MIKKRLLRAIAIISAHTHVRTFETLENDFKRIYCITNFIVEKGGNSIFMKRGEGVGGGRPVVVSTTRGQFPTFCVYTEKKCLAMPVLQKLIKELKLRVLGRLSTRVFETWTATGRE